MPPISSRALLLLSALLLGTDAGAETDSPLRLRLAPETPALAESSVPPLEERLPEALDGDGLSLAPADDRYGWWREDRDERPFRLVLSVADGDLDFGVLTVWNWHNEAVAQRRLAAGEETTIELAVEGRGAWLLTLDGFREGATRRRLIRSLARTADHRETRRAWRDDEFLLGICAFPGRYHWSVGGRPALPPGLSEDEARSREAELLARAGFGLVRPDVSVEMGPLPEAPDGYFRDFTRMDAAVEAYLSRGFGLALQIMNAGDWAIAAGYAGAEGHRQPYPRDEAHQRAWTRAILERYGRHARFVQIHNEPDQREFWAGTPEEFVAHYRTMLGEVRRLAPALPVANGGYCFVDEERSAFYVRELRGLSDYQAYHAHGPLATVKRNFARMRALHEAEGYEAPVYFNTETGFDAWRLDQERRQGQAVAQRTLYGWAQGHRGVLLFCGRMTRGPGREGRDLGLLDYEFGPRFAYAAVGALVGALAGASFDAILREEDDGLHLYRFRRRGGWVLAGFALGEGGECSVNAEAVALLDEMGNRRAAEREGGTTRLVLDGYPRYWVFEGDRAPELKTPFP
jgi:hypothetical protein